MWNPLQQLLSVYGSKISRHSRPFEAIVLPLSVLPAQTHTMSTTLGILCWSGSRHSAGRAYNPSLLSLKGNQIHFYFSFFIASKEAVQDVIRHLQLSSRAGLSCPEGDLMLLELHPPGHLQEQTRQLAFVPYISCYNKSRQDILSSWIQYFEIRLNWTLFMMSSGTQTVQILYRKQSVQVRVKESIGLPASN